MAFLFREKTKMIEAERALPGREQAIAVPERHFVLGNPIAPPFPEGLERAVFGMGCFWGAERMFWEADGVWTTAAGYAGGFTPNPTYEEVCSGSTGHAEAVLAVFDPAKTGYEEMLRIFWEGTTRPRACARATTPGRSTARRSTGTRRRSAGGRGVARDVPGARLSAAGYGDITTEIGRRARSTTPRTTTSSTSRRTRTATAAWADRRQLPRRAGAGGGA